MGKGDPKHRANKRKWERADMPALAPVKSSRKPRGPNGQFTGPAEDPRIVALDARCRHNGLKPDADNRRLVSAPAYEGHATLAITLSRANDTDRLLSLWTRIDADHAAYFRHVIGRTRFPNVAKLEMLPEVLEARPDDRPDLRDEEQKAKDAKASRARWFAIFRQLTGHERIMLDDGIWGVREFVRGGQLTTAGMAFVAALRVVHGMVEK